MMAESFAICPACLEFVKMYHVRAFSAVRKIPVVDNFFGMISHRKGVRIIPVGSAGVVPRGSQLVVSRTTARCVAPVFSPYSVFGETCRWPQARNSSEKFLS